MIEKKNFTDSNAKLSDKLKAIRTNDFNLKQMEYYDDCIGMDSTLPVLLNQPVIAQILLDVMHFNNMKKYEIICFCIMPNHVHLLIKPLFKSVDERYSISEIMHSIKSFSSKRINLELKRTGGLWQVENFDRVVRNEKELHNMIRYTLYNPVKANLCKTPGDWKYSYLSDKYGCISDV